MSEKEKMLQGELYDANDKQLVNERQHAKEMCYDYNFLRPKEIEKRNEIMRALLKTTKANFLIEQPFWCDYGYNIEIGEAFYANHHLLILDGNQVSFGDHVFIGPNCAFYTVSHPLDASQREKGLEYAKPIHVGSHVWIGGNTVVLPGVNIGDHTIIGAGSVVTHDIEPYVVAYGHPCKVIRKIEHDEESICEK